MRGVRDAILKSTPPPGCANRTTSQLTFARPERVSFRIAPVLCVLNSSEMWQQEMSTAAPFDSSVT